MADIKGLVDKIVLNINRSKLPKLSEFGIDKENPIKTAKAFISGINLNEKQLIILVGPPAAGKTTYYKMVYRDIPNYVWINQDELGREGSKRTFEQAVLDPRVKGIVVDRMNPTAHERKEFIARAKTKGYNVKIVKFDVDRETSYRGVMDREIHPTLTKDNPNIGVVVNKYYKDYEELTPEEYDELYVVKNKKEGWAQRVTRTSHALDLEPGVFTLDDPEEIALSIQRSAEASPFKKGTAYQSGIDMISFYINRAGTNLDAAEKRKLEQAKVEYRRLYGRE